MRGCKRLKNINSVSGKLGERQLDPLQPTATGRFGEGSLRNFHLRSILTARGRRRSTKFACGSAACARPGLESVHEVYGTGFHTGNV